MTQPVVQTEDLLFFSLRTDGIPRPPVVLTSEGNIEFSPTLTLRGAKRVIEELGGDVEFSPTLTLEDAKRIIEESIRTLVPRGETP
jgi:hypothetical protein